MNLSRGAQKLNQLLQSTNARSIQTLSPFLRDSLRHFSTGTEHQVQPQPPQSSTQHAPSLQPPSSGLVYGRLLGISSNTLKTDIINLFEGCKLTLDDIKVDYDRAYNPMAMLVQFSSMSHFGSAIRELTRKSRPFRLEKVVDHQKWDSVTPHNGRYVLFTGIPRNALLEDVERFLCGCNYEASSLDLFFTRTVDGPSRIAKVRFPSPIEAMNAVLKKNGSFCLNGRVAAQLIQ
ncbi:hypothetical protein SOVF_087620 [Spinacia oleracea]|uniref:RRM domain-containing protein n=1 Tax=Spinacia oleracea TaxID=3562 RepID=A0A9R0IF53_SPIOL|nr:uncharacterized protein LOC110786702 [Spinacia oleracea]KNA16571.1 hypothetical protein SOVF_087620 [Spinacia oleracea]